MAGASFGGTTFVRRVGAVAAVGGGLLALAGCNLGAPGITYPVTATGNYATDLALGDLDGDGDVDAVAAVNGGYAVGLNDGSGRFAVTQARTTPAPGWTTTLGDVDGDRHLDLVYVAPPPSADPPQIEVRRGDGTGRFATTRQVLPSGHAPHDLAVGDLDGDDDLDVMAATTGGLDVWLNDGRGRFDRPFAVDTGINPSDVAASDLDGDGDLDLVTGGYAPSDGVSVNLGDGAGGFSDPATYDLGPVDGFSGTTTIGVADMNEDGAPDVYGGNNTFDQVFVLPGTGDGRLGPAVLSPARTRTVPDVVAADIDVDGHLDLATSGSTVLFGDGTGSFPEEHPVYGGSLVATADLDANGQPDLAYADGANMRVLLNHLDGRRDHDEG